MDNTEKFNNKGEIYAKSRPRYAEALFHHMKHTLHIPDGCTFADIGSGTGIFSEQLLSRGYHVYAVEPNADMRGKAEERLLTYPFFYSVDGTDRNTSLPTESIDCVTTAQAFHWFDPNAFKRECRRILKPNGRVILVYNSRDENAECNKALAALHRRYCPSFQGFSNGINDEKCSAFFDGTCEIFRADNSQSYDWRGYINRALSSSYSLREGDAHYTEYLADVRRLFDTFSEKDRVVVPMHTVAYIGMVK